MPNLTVSTDIDGFMQSANKATALAFLGGLSTSAASGFATTAQISGLTNSAQVQALASAQIGAITPASIGALSTDAASGFATTSDIQGIAFTSQLSAFATTEQLSGYATTIQIQGLTNSAQVEALASAQIAAITPASIGALSTAAASSFATTEQLTGYATTTDIQGIAFTSQLSAFATTEQLSGYATTLQIEGLTNSAQVEALASAQIAAITPASIGALSTDAASGFATTSQLSGFATTEQLGGYATTTDIQGIAFTSQLSGFATTDQISGFTTSSQVQAIASAQISTITPASIGAIATSDVIQISQGGTGEITSTAALTALGGMPLNQAAGGDLSGTYPDPTVAKLQGYNVSSGAPFGGAILQWIDNEWSAQVPPSGSLTSITAGTGLTGGTITQTGTIALETTGVAALTYGSSTQVGVLAVNSFGQITSASNVAITPAGIGALSTDAASGFATTSQISGFATTGQLSGFATTTDIQGIAVTSQLSAFTNSAQVQSLASAQIAAITPGSIGAVATSDVIAISNGGTGSTSAVAALTALGAMSATQAAGGDLSGSLPSPTVAKIQGISVTNVTPLDGQVLQYDTATSTWVAGAIPNGGSGGGGQTFFFNYNTAAEDPTTGLPTSPTVVKELGRVSDTTGTSYTSGTLSQVTYDLVVHFVTDVLDPNITAIPAGLFDFNFWASSNANTANQTIVQLKVFKYDGTTATLLATSDDISIYDPTVAAQYIASVVLPQTTVALNDRLYIQFLAKATSNNRTVTFNFGATQPSHVHTTIPSVGGSGLVKVINGAFQSPASKLIDSDVATNAAISLSKIAMSEVSVQTIDGITGGGDLSTTRILSLTTTGVSALSYGSSTQVPAFTVDAYGRLSAASNVAISASGIGAQPALTSEAPASIAQGGTGATTAIAALNNLGGVASSALAGYATTGQLSGFATTSQLSAYQPALTSAAAAAIVQGGTGATTAVAALNNLGGITSAALSGYASTSQLAGLQTALTSAAPLAITQGGTGAITGDDALKNLGSSLHYVTLRTGNAQTPLAVSGSYTATWSTGSTTVTLATGNTSLFSQGNTFGAGGLAGTAIISITNSTQFVVSSLPTTTQATAAAITVFATTPTTFTYAPGVQPTNDGYLTVVGDVIAFGSQVPTPTHGPWVCTVAGAVGVSQVMTRPAWFTGNAAPILVQSLKGNTSQGNITAITSATASNNDIQVGLQGLGAHLIYQRANVPTLASNTFTGRQIFAATTTTVNPFNFQASTTMLTSLTAHAVEWDNSQMYITNTVPERMAVATSKAQINAQTGTTYTVTDMVGGSDAGKLITASNASPITISIPTDATANSNFPIGTQILVMQLGLGQVTVAAVTPGTTAVNSKNGTKTSGQYAVISLIKVAANSWVVGGDATT